MDAAEGRPGHVVVRESEAKADSGLRQQGEVNVAHAPRCVSNRWGEFGTAIDGEEPHGIEGPGGGGFSGFASKSKRNWGHDGKIDEVIPLIFVGSNAHGIVGIASPSEAVNEKIVEQKALVSKRLQGKRLIEETWTLLQIH